jgi:hypothetical protein
MANGLNNRVFDMMEAIVDQTNVDFSVDFDTFDDAVVPLPEEDREYGRPVYPEESRTTSIHMPSYAKLIEESDVKGSIWPKHWFRSWARSSDEEAILDRMYRGDDERGMVAYVDYTPPAKEEGLVQPITTGSYGKYAPSETEFEPDTVYIYPEGIKGSVTGEHPTLLHEVLHEDKLLHRGEDGPYFFNPLSSQAYNYYAKQMYGNLVDKYGKEELIKMLDDLIAGKKLNIGD